MYIHGFTLVYIYILYPPPCFSTFGVSEALHYPCPRSLLSSPFREPPPPPQHLSHPSHQPGRSLFYDAAFGAQIWRKWSSRGRPDMQSAHACACFGEVALFQEIYENFWKSTKKGAILGLQFGPEIDKTCSKLVPGASGVQNRGEGSDLGCKMEGKGPTWKAK